MSAEVKKEIQLEIAHAGGLAVTYARMGRKEDARRVLNQILEKERTTYVKANSIASIHAELGQNDEAFRWLERAYTEHDADLLGIATDVSLRALRSDPRFGDLLGRIHLDPATASKDEDKP
jgi:tetratricopeptide (TPR) repeat protein